MRAVSIARTGLAALTVAVLLQHPLAARDTIPPDFRGEWVPQRGSCDAPLRLIVAESTLTLANGKDRQTWGNVGVPTSFFGPDYKGISAVALPDFDGDQPFTVYFNADEKKGITKVSIYIDMGKPRDAAVARIQAAAKALATRFPLDDVPLRKCP